MLHFQKLKLVNTSQLQTIYIIIGDIYNVRHVLI